LRISLLNPPYSLDDYFGSLSRTGSIQQPLGIAYVSSFLKVSSHKVQLIDGSALRCTVHDLVREVSRFHPDIVGITATTPGYRKALELAKQVKGELGLPIILGGPHVTSLAPDTLGESVFDYGVIGEGEITTLNLLDTLERGGELSRVEGIAFKKDGEVKVTPRREYIKDLDLLPFPDRDSLPPLSAYRPSPSSYRRLPLGTMVTSRGCPHHCIFCDRAVFGNLYRARGASNVVDEMEALVTRHGAKEVRFWDDTFNLYPKRVIQICEEIIRRKLDVEWTCVARVSNMTSDILKTMRRAGCWQVDYGIETGNAAILAGIQKGITIDLVRRAVAKSRSNGLHVRGFFMLGLPGETSGTMRETIEFAKTLALDVAVFHITTPLPGTELYTAAKQRGEISHNAGWENYLMFSADNPPYVTSGLTKGLLQEYHRRAYREFYLRPRFLIEQMARVRTPEDIIRYGKALTTVASFD
jgi:radical SAM superfamily enzyme YgiQ (UPF0313 family)